MADKQNLIRDMQHYNAGGAFMTKAQIAAFFGTKKAGQRVNRTVEHLRAYDGKYYRCGDIADALLQRSR